VGATTIVAGIAADRPPASVHAASNALLKAAITGKRRAEFVARVAARNRLLTGATQQELDDLQTLGANIDQTEQLPNGN
jgi:hypothetical protein